MNKLFKNTQDILNPVIFFVQLQTIFGEINLKQKAEEKLLRLK